MRRLFIKAAVLFALSVFVSAHAQAQTRKRKPEPKKSQTSASIPDAKPDAQATPAPPKRNERPDAAAVLQNNNAPTVPPQAVRQTPAYRYEFSQPDFVVSVIRIEHDEQGSGKIEFRKKGSDETITDPVTVSAKALARINEALDTLNFVDSTENYQYEKDFSHLGVIKFALRKNGRSREVTFNWSDNKDAKILMNEYRKLSNQYIWVFDISLSRENQPLESPRLFDSLESMIKRNEISDPYQMEPLLRDLSNDERIPLIARNHASKLIKQFEKERAKEEKKKEAAN